MRNCPVCGKKEDRYNLWSVDFVVPDGWELPTHNEVCWCLNCGMVYYDNDKTQADYDAYYGARYNSDPVLVSEATHKRLNGLVDFILGMGLDKDASIVDFGAGEGYVKRVLTNFSFSNVHGVNVGDELPKHIDLLIASHVLEHIYDMRSVMEKLTQNTDRILVDVPASDKMVQIGTLPILDYHQKHINHFTTRTLNFLFERYGYFPVSISTYTDGNFNYPAIRVLYERFEKRFYSEARELIEKNIAEKSAKLAQITEPVIVWGCGDICFMLLDKVTLNVVHYVDNDPAFRGQTIGGVPVLDHVESDAPIVVIAQMQKDQVLERIKQSGIKNRVIVI